MAKSLLLTGIPGIGKTTIIRRVVASLGDRAGGFYTQEIKGPGGRQGFKLVTLTGQEITLSHKDFRDPNQPHVGRYGVDVAAFERVGVQALSRAIDEGKLVVVDEIGKMELFSRDFQDVLVQAIMGPSHIIGTIMAHPIPEAEVFTYLAQVELWEVDRRNRGDMPARVIKWIETNA